MKKSVLLILLIATAAIGFSQTYPGYNLGNYTGVNGVFFNPANIAASRYRWDFNLIGVHAGVTNNNASFKIKDMGDLFDSKLDSLLLGSSGKNTNGLANIDVFGPSVMFNINSKTSIALTTRVRALINIKDLDGKLVQSIDNDIENLPISLGSSANQKIVVNGWADFGLSLGQVLYNEDHHFLKGGVTVKYLGGVANGHANIASFSGSADEDVVGTYITNATGAVSVGTSGVDFTSDDFETGDLVKFKSSGFGADVGFVYEYRPNGDVNTERYPNKYKYKIGISLMDMGSIKYTPDPAKSGAYSVNISPAQKWYPQDLDGKSFEEIKTYLDGSPYFTNLASAASSYKASLPTNLQFALDYNVHKGLYVGLGGQLNVAKKEDKFTSFYNNNFSLVPRYEGRGFGASLPLSYNELSKFNAGISLRVGPLFIGSGSIITALMSKSKQADLHVGLRFGGLKKKDVTPTKKITVVEETVYKKKKVKKHKASQKEDNKVPVKETPKTELVKTEVVAVTPAVTTVVTAADTDGDGILDAVDKCPLVAGVFKYDGCPIPDADGDGVNDEMDSCKTVAGSAKYNGCPIPDTDSDGVNDEMDSCKTIAGLARYNGCPIPDGDKDGINDEEDNCPTTAGTAKYKGCPVPDTDGDGINDDEDKCPGLAGTKANFGCPDVKKGVIKKDVLNKIKIAAKGLQFAPGKSVILKNSYAQLNNVVKILKADPALELNIEGHTDSLGNAEKNMQLSIDRANAAKAYLVKKGIAESRIIAEGFGATQPIATNKTAAGRLKNRRVVFTLSK